MSCCVFLHEEDNSNNQTNDCNRKSDEQQELEQTRGKVTHEVAKLRSGCAETFERVVCDKCRHVIFTPPRPSMTERTRTTMNISVLICCETTQEISQEILEVAAVHEHLVAEPAKLFHKDFVNQKGSVA